jgi:hypothetical protein
MGRISSTHGREGRETNEELIIDGRIILKWTLRK